MKFGNSTDLLYIVFPSLNFGKLDFIAINYVTMPEKFIQLRHSLSVGGNAVEFFDDRIINSG